MTPWLDGKQAARKPMETRNLLADKPVSTCLESTFLRQQVCIIREVTSQNAEIVAFGRNFQESFSTTCSGEVLSRFIKGQIPLSFSERQKPSTGLRADL